MVSLAPPQQNWWEGNRFMMPPVPTGVRQPPRMGMGAPGGAPLPTTSSAPAFAPLSMAQDAGGGDSQGMGFTQTPPSRENRFGAMELPWWASGGLNAAGMLVPGVGPLAAGIGLMNRGSNVNANSLARESIGLPGLSLGQTAGGLFGLNQYGRGIDPVGESAIGEEPGYMSEANATAAGLDVGEPALAHGLGVANVPGGIGTGTGFDENMGGEAWQPVEQPQPSYDMPSIFDFGGYREGGALPEMRGKTEPVPAVLHTGEFVIRPEAVQKYGRELLEALNAGRVPLARMRGLFG